MADVAATTGPENATIASPESDPDRARADAYAILAALLSHTPGEDLVDYLRHIPAAADAETGDMGTAWQQLAEAARLARPQALDDEYHALFIGLGRGEVVPYGSWHLTGLLMDKPLSELRDDLRALGIEADDTQKDPEDHIAALCETMSLVISAPDTDEAAERRFYVRHIHPWAGKFFTGLVNASSAEFYRAVGHFGLALMAVENRYLNVQAH